MTPARSPCSVRAPAPCPSTSTSSPRRFLPAHSSSPRAAGCSTGRSCSRARPSPPTLLPGGPPQHTQGEPPPAQPQGAGGGRRVRGQGHPELPAGSPRQEALPPPLPLPVVLCPPGPRNHLPGTLGPLGGCTSQGTLPTKVGHSPFAHHIQGPIVSGGGWGGRLSARPPGVQL